MCYRRWSHKRGFILGKGRTEKGFATNGCAMVVLILRYVPDADLRSSLCTCWPNDSFDTRMCVRTMFIEYDRFFVLYKQQSLCRNNGISSIVLYTYHGINKVRQVVAQIIRAVLSALQGVTTQQRLLYVPNITKMAIKLVSVLLYLRIQGSMARMSAV